MSDKFQNKYRIPSARAIWWDYRDEGAYFVTICTAGREYYFGEIADGQMQLSEIGEIARQCWQEIPNHFPFVKLDAFVVMPNHVHGVLVIDKKYDGGRDAIHRVSYPPDNDSKHLTNEPDSDKKDETKNARGVLQPVVNIGDAMNRVSTVQQTGGITGENNPMLWNNLARVIRWFKGRTTYYSRPIHAEFGWQTRFWDHIIRDNESYYKIRKYIEDNPARWGMDQLNNDNIQNT